MIALYSRNEAGLGTGPGLAWPGFDSPPEGKVRYLSPFVGEYLNISLETF